VVFPVAHPAPLALCNSVRRHLDTAVELINGIGHSLLSLGELPIHTRRRDGAVASRHRRLPCRSSTRTADASWRRDDLHKKFGQVTGLNGLTLDVDAGEIFGLLGPNGAGKSATVGVLTTRVQATSGEGWIGRYRVSQDRVAVKRAIGVVPQRPNLDFGLTTREILTFHGAYFGLNASTRNALADQLLDRFKLTDRTNSLVFGFSGGMMQRLSIARAMMHDPEVLFLDEPSAGLDPQTRLLLWEIVREYNARGRTIVLTTHNMDEAGELCRRVAIVDHGNQPAGLRERGLLERPRSGLSGN